MNTVRSCLALIVCLVTLSACTTIQLEPLPEGLTDQPPADWSARTEQLTALQHWQLMGKLAVRQPSDSGSAVINQWTQHRERYDLSLSSAFLGLGSTRLTGTPGFMELTLPDGDVYRSGDPEALVAAATGWQLPLSDLTWWVRGLPNPGSNYRLFFDQQQRVAMIRQGGWEIRYDRWRSFIEPLPELPARITALRGERRVRLAITDWQLAEQP